MPFLRNIIVFVLFMCFTIKLEGAALHYPPLGHLTE